MFLSHNFSSATRDSRLLLASGNRHLMAALSTDTFHIHMYSTLAVLCAHCIRLSFSLFLARALTFAVSSSMHSGTMTNFSGVTFNADLWIHFFFAPYFHAEEFRNWTSKTADTCDLRGIEMYVCVCFVLLNNQHIWNNKHFFYYIGKSFVC